MPGAHEAVEAANKVGRTLLLTAKHAPNARLHVDRLGLPVGEVFGGAWREAKAVVLREQGATTYVGDHVHDMDAAKFAGVVGCRCLDRAEHGGRAPRGGRRHRADDAGGLPGVARPAADLRRRCDRADRPAFGI